MFSQSEAQARAVSVILVRSALQNETELKSIRAQLDTSLDMRVADLDVAGYQYGEGKPGGTVKSTLWHSDKSFRPEPSMLPRTKYLS